MVQSSFTRASRPGPLEKSVAWSECTVTSGYGTSCRRSVPEGSPLSICGEHLIEAYRFCEDALDIAANDGVPRMARSDRYLRFEVWEQRYAQPAEPTVIYYALVDGVVKIGITTNVKKRMLTLKADALLATEQGGWDLENLRHEQFAHLRAPIARHRELFMPGDDLIAHIEMLRRAKRKSQRVAA